MQFDVDASNLASIKDLARQHCRELAATNTKKSDLLSASDRQIAEMEKFAGTLPEDQRDEFCFNYSLECASIYRESQAKHKSRARIFSIAAFAFMVFAIVARYLAT